MFLDKEVHINIEYGPKSINYIPEKSVMMAPEDIEIQMLYYHMIHYR